MKFNRRRKQEDNRGFFQKATESWLGVVFLLFLSGLLLYNIVKSIMITSEKVEILNQAEREVSGLRLNNLELITLTEYMTSDEYLETEARNRLNLSKKGEVSFVIPEEILEKGISEVEEILNDKKEVSADENWVIWYDFFISGI